MVENRVEHGGRRDDLPDPWEGAHDIEYWVWNGMQLAPASDEQVERIHEHERTLAAMSRLERWEAERRQTAGWHWAHRVYGRVIEMIAARLGRTRRGAAASSADEAARVDQRPPLRSGGA